MRMGVVHIVQKILERGFLNIETIKPVNLTNTHFIGNLEQTSKFFIPEGKRKLGNSVRFFIFSRIYFLNLERY